jgi:hypothetical protein
LVLRQGRLELLLIVGKVLHLHPVSLQLALDLGTAAMIHDPSNYLSNGGRRNLLLSQPEQVRFQMLDNNFSGRNFTIGPW